MAFGIQFDMKRAIEAYKTAVANYTETDYYLTTVVEVAPKMKTNHQASPTIETYSEFQLAYDYFNSKLFNQKLPSCLITLQRHGRSYGYFSPKRFKNRHDENKLTDEIAINPDYINQVDEMDVLATLVHEMVHLQQAHFGTPSRKGYHNNEWASMMEAVGLIPSDTGQPGGAKTGQTMSHYIAQNGVFAQACKQLLTQQGINLSWGDSLGQTQQKSKNGHLKYTCPTCHLNAWAKPELSLFCGTCKNELVIG